MSDDPYLAFEPQNNDIQEYPANIGIYFWLFLSFIGIGVGATSIILSIQDQTLWPALFAIAITVLIIFSISYMPKSIICTKDEIIIRYWLKKSTKKIPWKNIYGLRIKMTRGYWGHLNAIDEKVSFPVGILVSMKNPKTLISTIRERGSLSYIWGDSAHNVQYTRVQ